MNMFKKIGVNNSSRIPYYALSDRYRIWAELDRKPYPL